MSIYVCGDTHGCFDNLNKFIEDKNPSAIFICGDFGYWIDSKSHKFYHEDIISKNTKIYFCDGNHENHVLLNNLVKTHGYENPIEVAQNIYYCPRGSSYLLEDGRRILFMGGANSIDKKIRKSYVDWFPEEIITYEDISRVDNKLKYDIVISHTCPLFLRDKLISLIYNMYSSETDISEHYLQLLFERTLPKKWYFGHWHISEKFNIYDCYFRVLNMLPYAGMMKSYENSFEEI